MCRALVVGVFVVVFTGCQLPPERLPVKPLPEDGPPLPYADLVLRARLQATAANEAFYIDNWTDLEDVARGLELTARFLGKATEVPVKHQDKFMVDAGDLGKSAAELRAAAKAKDVKQANEVLQRINLKVRQLRPES